MPGRFRKAGWPGQDESTSRSKGPHRGSFGREGRKGHTFALESLLAASKPQRGVSPRRTGVRQARRALLIGPDTSVSGSKWNQAASDGWSGACREATPNPLCPLPNPPIGPITVPSVIMCRKLILRQDLFVQQASGAVFLVSTEKQTAP